MKTESATATAHPLRQRAFPLLWIASFCTEATRWMLLIALPMYALSLTGSALVTSLVAMFGLLPSLVLTPLAGVLADRLNRSRLMAWLMVTRALLLLPLLFVQDSSRLWVVYLVVAAEAGLTAMFEAVKNAVVPTVVPAEQLVTANAAISLNGNLGRLVGSPVGGFVLAGAGIRGVIAAAVVPLLVTVALVLAVPARQVPRRPEAAPRWAGLRLMWRARALRAVAVVVGMLAIAQGLFVILFLLFVTERLGGGEAEAGMLRGVQAVGGLLGGVVTGYLARALETRRLIACSLLAFGLVSLLTWDSALWTTALWYYAALFTLVGAPGTWIMAGWLSLAQEATPDHLRGRVMSVLFALFDGLQAVGMLAAGILAGFLPTLAVLNGQAAVFFLAALLVWLMLATPARSREPAPAAEPVSDTRR